MKTSALKVMTMLLGSVIFGLAGTHDAFAVSVAGSSGKDSDALNDVSCFSLVGVQVRSNPACGAGLSSVWVVPLPANAGSHPISVSGTNASAGTMTCQVCSATNAFIPPVCSSLVFPANTTSVASATVSVGATSSLFFQCQFPPNSGINTINYNQ